MASPGRPLKYGERTESVHLRLPLSEYDHFYQVASTLSHERGEPISVSEAIRSRLCLEWRYDQQLDAIEAQLAALRIRLKVVEERLGHRSPPLEEFRKPLWDRAIALVQRHYEGAHRGD